MGGYLYFSALQDFFRLRRTWPWIGLGLFACFLGIGWSRLAVGSNPTENYAMVSAMLVFHVLPLASAILTSAVVSQEVEQRTIVYLLTRPVSRWQLLVCRYFASVTVVAALCIVSAVLVSAGIYGGNAFANPLLHKDIMAIIIGAAAYGALFLMTSLLINRSMMICLLFAFGWEFLAPNMFGEMYRLSIYSHVMAIAEHPTSRSSGALTAFMSGALSTNTISVGSAYATLIILAALLVAMSSMWFTHFEFVPREDAE